MKNIFIFLFAALFVLSSCEDFDFNDQGFQIVNLPRSVAFDAPGDNTSADGGDDEGESLTVEVELPGGTLEDVTVTYSLGGTATFGTDYTIAGATATGGTLTIVSDPNSFTEFDDGSVTIELLNDLVADDGETIIMTLESAVGTETGESIAVGRGGTDILRTATFTIGEVGLELSANASSFSRFESAVSDTVRLIVSTNFSAGADVTYDLSIRAGESTLTAGADFNYVGGFTEGAQTLASGSTADTVDIVLVDNGALNTGGAADGIDSVLFELSAPAVTGGGTIALASAQTIDTVELRVQDDFKRYNWTAGSDTIEVSVSGTGNTILSYTVALTDTLSSAASAAFADLTVPVALDGSSTAVAGTDFDAPVSIEILAGGTEAIFVVNVPSDATDESVATFVLGAAASADAEIEGPGSGDTIILRFNN